MTHSIDKPLLQLDGLAVRAGRRVLFDGLTLQARAGELWCVVGPNGAGKTTLLHTLSGLQPPAAGRIALAGKALADWRAGEAACVRGLLPQGADALYGITVLQAALLGRHPHRPDRPWALGDSAEDRAIAQAALARFDLTPLAARDVDTLSGGERQRTALASLLAQDPLVWLLDEPLSFLDLPHQVATMALLREEARRGRLVIASLHDLSLAARHATHALVIGSDGRCRHGPAAEVLAEPVLSQAYGHAIRRLGEGEAVAFIAA